MKNEVDRLIDEWEKLALNCPSADDPLYVLIMATVVWIRTREAGQLRLERAIHELVKEKEANGKADKR